MRDIQREVVDYFNRNQIDFEQINHASAGSVEEYRQTPGTRLEQLNN